MAVGLAITLAAMVVGCARQPAMHGSDPARIAAIFSGPVSDHDFNALGLDALEAAARDGASTTYTPSVSQRDAERILRTYAADGNTIIWAHGSQFYDATARVARENPAVTFIAEYDGRPADQPANVWVLDRQFHLGFYALGALASELTKTGTIGYVGGLPLPYSHAEVHAMRQAIHDAGATTTVHAVWTGDFNDPTKARQAADTLIAEGADVIVGSLNGGGVGLFDAAAAASTGGRHVWVTTKYTDTARIDPGDNRAGTLLYDYSWPLKYLVAKIALGERTGYYPMGLASGVHLEVPATVPAAAGRAAQIAVARITDGRVTVTVDTSVTAG